jgi:hypothetical protein
VRVRIGSRLCGIPLGALSTFAVNRVHVALAELRKRGLKGVLLKGDHGYHLDPDVEVRRVLRALCPG